MSRESRERRDFHATLFQRIRRRLKETAAPSENSHRYAEDRDERERRGDADVFSNAREAKTNNAKANIFSANFGSDDLSSRPTGILIRRPKGYLCAPILFSPPSI